MSFSPWFAIILTSHFGLLACRHEPHREKSRHSSAQTIATGSARVGEGSARVDSATNPPIDAGDEGSASALANNDSEQAAMPEWSDEALAKRVPNTDGPRYYAKNRHVWIYPEPNIALQWIGFLWTGGSVRLKRTRPIYGPGCTFYYEILPWGYVCTDGNRGTIDPDDPVYRQLLRYAPRTDSPWPHRYGKASPLTRYFSFPAIAANRKLDAGRDPSNDEIIDFHALSPSVHEAHTSLIDRSTVAYTAETRHDGQDWLLTSDYALIPKQKVTPYSPSQFRGVHLTNDISLPIAFFRGNDRPRYALSTPDKMESAGKPYARLSWVKLTGQHKRLEDLDWLETSDGGWVKASDATVPTPSALTPWGTPVGDSTQAASSSTAPAAPVASSPTARTPATPTPATPRGRATWIEVSIVGGWLIAYEGGRPVFTTLISPGSGGLPRKGQAAIDTFSTPLGRFQINGKFVSSTMIGPTGLIHSEVPYAQNFADLYAIHTAYWHDNWGYPMSGGCVNVSPIDGFFLFHWTEPMIPEGWYGVRWIPSKEPSTTVIIHR